jgi:hypothetical protein
MSGEMRPRMALTLSAPVLAACKGPGGGEPGPLVSTASSGSTSTSDGASTTVDGTTGEGSDTAAPAGDPAPYREVMGCPDPVGTWFSSEGTSHVPEGSDLSWDHDPPHSGPHYPSWAEWGEWAEVVPRGKWVHNLEHGGIVLLHNCPSPCDAEIAVLREALSLQPDARILLTADPEIDPPRFAAVAWRWVLETDAPELAALLCFIDQHEGHAPEDVRAWVERGSLTSRVQDG